MCDCHVPKLSLLHDMIQSSFLNIISTMSLILLKQYATHIREIMPGYKFLESDIIDDINHLIDILDTTAECL